MVACSSLIFPAAAASGIRILQQQDATLLQPQHCTMYIVCLITLSSLHRHQWYFERRICYMSFGGEITVQHIHVYIQIAMMYHMLENVYYTPAVFCLVCDISFKKSALPTI